MAVDQQEKDKTQEDYDREFGDITSQPDLQGLGQQTSATDNSGKQDVSGGHDFANYKRFIPGLDRGNESGAESGAPGGKLGERVGQAKQIASELGSALGKPGTGAPGKQGSLPGAVPSLGDREQAGDQLTRAQRMGTDTAKSAIQLGRALAGDERVLADLGKHPVQTAKQLKNTMLVLAGLAACLFLGFFMIFMFLTSFSNRHVSEVFKDTAFAPLDTVGARGVAELFSAKLYGKASDPDSMVAPLDPVALTENLKETGKISFKKGGETIGLEAFMKLSDSQKASYKLVTGTSQITVPAGVGSTANAEVGEFIKDFELAIKSNNLFANDSRIFRSPLAKKIYQQNGIQLMRWQDSAKDIDSYSNNMKSLYEKIRDPTLNSTPLDDVNKAGDQLNSSTTELLSKDLSRGTKGVAIVTSDMAWNTATGTKSLAAFSANASDTVFTISAFCSARGYLDSYPAIVKQKYIDSQKAGLKLLSSADQTEVGSVNPKAVDAEAQQIEFYENDKQYLKAINADVTGRRPTLNESQNAYQDPRVVKAAMQGIVNVFEKPFGDGGFVSSAAKALGGGGGGLLGTVSDLVGGALDLVTSVPGFDSLTDALTDVGADLLCEALTSGGGSIAMRLAGLVIPQFDGFGTLGKVAILQAVKSNLETAGATELAKQLDLDKNLFTTPTEGFMEFLFRTHKTQDYSGLQDGAELAAMEWEGIAAFGNEVARQLGARPMNLAEKITLENYNKNRRTAVLKNKPLSYRLFSLDNARSPLSILAARTPKSTLGLQRITNTQLAASLSPVSAVSRQVASLASSISGSSNVAYALDNQPQDVRFAYTPAELKKIATDPSFLPDQNKAIVASRNLAATYSTCYTSPMTDLILAEGDDSLSMFDDRGKCTAEALAGDDALHYRVSLLYNSLIESLVDIQTIVEDQ